MIDLSTLFTLSASTIISIALLLLVVALLVIVCRCCGVKHLRMIGLELFPPKSSPRKPPPRARAG